MEPIWREPLMKRVFIGKRARMAVEQQPEIYVQRLMIPSLKGVEPLNRVIRDADLYMRPTLVRDEV